MNGALTGIRVLDFSSLLPGPLATLMLADAGAEVIKVERAGDGDGKREEPPVFAVLNRGKRSLALDLKAPGAVASLEPLIAACDVLVEQFRPGVMDRLGLGYERLRRLNPRLIYVSLNGYGSTGECALKPGHDLTYSAEMGLLSLNVGEDGAPVLPGALTSDIGGGSFPAVVNVLMALLARERTGQGTRIEVSMFAASVSFLYEAWALALGEQRYVGPGSTPSTGSSPRYAIYRAADDRFVAAAPAEEKFWRTFCEIIGLGLNATREEVAARIRQKTGEEWRALFKGRDVCAELVLSVDEALSQPAMQALMDRQVTLGELSLPALPSVVSPALRATGERAMAPALGEANAEMLAAASPQGLC